MWLFKKFTSNIFYLKIYKRIEDKLVVILGNLRKNSTRRKNMSHVQDALEYENDI